MRIEELPAESSGAPPNASSPTPVVPLDYSSRERRSATPKVIAFLRRLAIAAGISFMAGAIGIAMFPYKDEEVAFFCVGLGLVLLAIPLPKTPGW
jgi:hypothetical protein